MKKKKLNKDIRKSITHSWGRFISIMLLMGLGSFALVGLFVAGPDMRETGKDYFNDYNTADITVISDYGIDESEREYIEKASGIKDLEYIYLKDVVEIDSNMSFRIFSNPKKVSLYEIKEGKLPIEDNEIAIDYTYKENYNIGDTVSFYEKLESEDSEETLKIHEFKITGFIYSSEILSNLNRGQTTAGTGELDSYAIVNPNVFNSDVYMMAKITFEDTSELDPYTDEYTELIQIHKEELSELLKQQQGTRLLLIKEEYQIEINEARAELEDAKKELEDARKEIADAKKKLEDGKIEISKNEKKLLDAKKQIEDAEKEISSNESLLAQKQNEYNSGQITISEKQAEYDAGVATLTQKEQEYNKGKVEIEKAQTELVETKAELEYGKIQYESAILQLEEAIIYIQSEITNYKELLNNAETEEEKENINRAIAEYEKNLNEYQTQLEEAYTFINTTYPNGIAKITETEKIINSKNEELKNAELQINEAKNVLNAAKIELDRGYNELASAKAQLDSANSTLASAKAELSSAKKEYNDGVQKLNEAKTELNEKEKEYNEKLQEFNEKEPDAIKEIEDAEKDISDAQEKIDKLELPTYSVYTRREIPGGEGYRIYTTVSEIIDSLAKIFPIFLYFVAALVTLTTMTRFVNEERINSGTLKALGYEDKDITKKFTVYGLIAGMTGTILGVILGHILIPNIVYSAYSSGFTIPKIEIHFYMKYTILAIILSLFSSVIPAYIVSKRELKEKPASLLMPKAPKAGSKILLERIKPIWNKMSFTHKVTARNIFRYKSRMFMTIFGVAGGVALLFTGFSVRASISEINERQFSDIIKYDMIVAHNEDLSSEDIEELNNLLNSNDVNNYSTVYYEAVSIVAGDKNDEEEIKLIVPEDDNTFRNYINLVNRSTEENLEFSNDGVIISERLAKLLNLKLGDSFKYIDSKENEIEVKISGICEMYTGHFIFMNSIEYETVTGKNYVANANLVLLNDKDIENTKEVATKFMKLSAVAGIVQNTTLYNQIETIVNSLNQIMTVLIIVAAMLTIVIIYNLTNINVTERIRELCTIKVLGFRDKEVTMYIYRETICLTILAIIVGWIIGLGLHSYILAIVPPDEVMFNPSQWIGSFIIPLLTVSAITFILKIYVNNKLKYVDMLDALKSVE